MPTIYDITRRRSEMAQAGGPVVPGSDRQQPEGPTLEQRVAARFRERAERGEAVLPPLAPPPQTLEDRVAARFEQKERERQARYERLRNLLGDAFPPVMLGEAAEKDAAIVRLSEATGLDPELVRRNFDPIQRAWQKARFDPVRFTKAEPDLAELVLRRPELAKAVAKDLSLKTSAGDHFWQFLSGLGKGEASLIRGLGMVPQLIGEYTTTPVVNWLFGTNYRTGNLLDPVADFLHADAEAAAAKVSEGGRAQLAGSTPSGDLLDPSTWSLGEDPSLRGYLLQGLDVFGGMLPLVVTSFATAGAAPSVQAAAGGIAGGLQGGGAAAEQARAEIERMANTPAHLGSGAPSLLEQESEVYRRFREAGLSHDEAVRRTADEAAKWAFVFTGPAAAVGGAATARILSPATRILAGRGRAVQLLGRTAIGSLEEGSQEAVESIATTAGIGAGAGVQVDLTEGTFGDFLLGAIAGGGTGVVGHLGVVSQDLVAARGREQHGAATGGAVLQAAGASALFQSSPDEFVEAVKAKTRRAGEEVDTLYISPEPLLKAFEEHGTPAVEVLGAEGAARLMDAIATGEKFALPLREIGPIARHPSAPVIATEHTTIRPHYRTPAEIRSEREADEAAAAALVEEYSGPDAPPMDEQEAALIERLQAQLAGTKVLSAEEARLSLAELRAFIRTMSRRFGVAPDELFAGYEIVIERGPAEAASPAAVAQEAPKDGEKGKSPAAMRSAGQESLEGSSGMTLGPPGRTNVSAESDAVNKTPGGDFGASGTEAGPLTAPESPGTDISVAGKPRSVGAEGDRRQLRLGADFSRLPAPQPVNPDGQLTAFVGEPTALSELEEEIGRADAHTKAWKRVRDWLRPRISGTYTNENTGWRIVVGKGGIRESLSRGKLTTWKGLASVPELIQAAVFDPKPSEPDPSEQPSVRAYHYGYAPIVIDGELYRAKLVVRETNEGEFFYLFHPESLEIERPASITRARDGERAAAEDRRPPGSITVRQLFAGAKRRDGTKILPDIEARWEARDRLEQAAPAAGPRGWMEREGNRFRIVLTPNADRSTFLHETGHAILEMFLDLAQRDDAPRSIREDRDQIFAWLGITDRSELRREHHEQFARANEVYLMEGKAPSSALVRAFERFRIWLTRIYRQATALGVELSDEVRGVFDRLLAIDEEIAAARAAAGIRIPREKPPHLTDEEWEREQEVFDRLERAEWRKAALRALELRQRELEKWWREEKTTELEQAEAEYDELKETRDWRYVRFGELMGEKLPKESRLRLDRGDVEEAIGKENARRLHGVLVKKGGERLEDVAQQLGYPSGKEMLTTLLQHPDKKTWAEATAERRMREKHPDLFEDRRRLRELVQQAHHGEEGIADVDLIEYASLTREAGGPRVTVEAIDRAAREMVQRQRVGYLNPDRTIGEERRARIRKERALARRDYPAAKKAAQEILLLSRRWRKEKAAEQRVERFQDLGRRLADAKRRGEIGRAEPELREVIDALTLLLGFRRPSQDEPTAVSPNGLAGAIAGRLNDIGVPPVFEVGELEGVLHRIPPATRSRVPWEKITVADMDLLLDVMDQLRTAGSVVAEMYIQDRRRSREEMARLIAEEASRLPDLGLEPQDPARQPRDGGGLSAFFSEYDNPESWFERLGPTAMGIWRRFQERLKLQQELNETIGAELMRRWEEMPAEMQARRYELLDAAELPVSERVRREDGPVTRQWLWMLFLNWGNEGNRQRLLDGYGWTEQQVVAFMERHLTVEEISYLQGILDITEKLRPYAEEIYEKLHGLPPGRVQPAPFALRLASGEMVTVRGGYFPARYDVKARDASQGFIAARQEDAGVQDHRASMLASISQSFVQRRAPRFTGPISLDFGIVPAHMQQVIRYVAFEEFVRDFNGLLRNDTFLETVERRLGLPYVRRVQDGRPRDGALQEWIKAVAGEGGSVASATEMVLGNWGINRGNFIQSSLAWNARAWAGDILEVLRPLFGGDIPKRKIVDVIARMAHPFGYRQMFEEALANSAEVRKRHATLAEAMREVQELVKTGRRRPGKVGKVFDWVEQKSAPLLKVNFLLQERIDLLTSVIIWHVGKEAALEDLRRHPDLRGAGSDRLEQAPITPESVEKQAERRADEILGRSKPPAASLEMSSIIRDKKGIWYFLAFFGWRNSLGQWTRRQIRERGWRGAADAYAFLLLTNTIGSLLVGDGLEDDEGWSEWFVRKALAAPALLIPIVGSAWEEAANLLVSGKHRRLGWVTSGPIAGLERSYHLGTRALREDDPALAAVLLGSAAAIPFGLPATQTQRTGEAILDLLRGEVDIEDPLDVPDALLFGTSPHRGTSILSPTQAPTRQR